MVSLCVLARMQKKAWFMFPIMCLRTVTGFTVSSAALRVTSAYPRSLSRLASEPSPTSATADAKPTAKRIQGTGGLRQLPKVEPANELVSRAKNRVCTKDVLVLMMPSAESIVS